MSRSLVLFASALALAGALYAAPRRLVIVKADGLPGDVVDRWVRTSDPKTGRSVLPWIDHVFIENGAWVRNFYTRGISLSAPAWSMLDSGQHLIIHGNAEYDRYSLQVYDYLNFFPFYLANARSRHADMPSVEVLDQAGIPLLIDQFAPEDRYQSMQLFQRGVRWRTLGRGARNRITSRSMRQLFDEWQTGFEFASTVTEQVEREVISRIADNHTQYVDFFFGDYDHVMHLANDETSQLEVMRKLDALIGRLWTAIQKSPLAADTILVLLSDHGMNSEPGVYSQGFNLIRFFNSAEGGGHHVITNRHPMTEYKLKGLDPFVTEVLSPSNDSLYLANEAASYPTAVLDLDGNERASVQLRNSDLNRIHQLLQEISAGGENSGEQLMAILNRHRVEWTRTAAELEEELAALRKAIERQRLVVAAQQKRFNRKEHELELDEPPKRERASLASWEQDERGYGEYLSCLRRLLALKPQDLETGRNRVDQLVPRRAMGDANRLHELQNYAAGPSHRIDYPKLLTAARVLNNVQPGVSPRPVDFVAVGLDSAGVRSIDETAITAVFVYAGENQQAILLAREAGGKLMIRYLPVAHLLQAGDGSVTYEPRQWSAGLPLQLYEDPNLDVAADRAEWLSRWHSDQEWLEAVHRTVYSNGVVGLIEHFGPVKLGDSSRLWNGAGADAPVLKRFEQRKRALVASDMLLLASDHWNFNVRGFNPGGNHGSFFRVSTDSTLMLAGAGIRPGQRIDRPYDSLSFFPTVLRLAGLETQLQEQKPYPGRIIQELIP